MKITDGLLGEHALFYPLFDRSAALAVEARTSEEVSLLMALLAPAIHTHAELEDDLLFPALARAGLGEGPVQVMRAEHVEIEAMIRETLQARGVDDARESFMRLLDFLADHFRREEAVVFPLSQQLGQEALLELGERWKERRGFQD